MLIRTELNDPGQAGTLVGATIPLHAAGGAWSLTVRLTKLIDAKWVPRYYKITDTTTYTDSGLDWVDFAPLLAKIDLADGRGDGTGQTQQRQHRNGGVGMCPAPTATKGGSSLLVTSAGGNVTLYDRPRVDRTRRPAPLQSVGVNHRRPSRSIKVRVGIDTDNQGVIWGAWAVVQKRQNADRRGRHAPVDQPGGDVVRGAHRNLGHGRRRTDPAQLAAVQRATWKAS